MCIRDRLCTRYVCTWYQPADERSARGRTRLTTVTCISCRSLWRQLLLYLYFIFIPITFIRAKRVSNCYIPKKKFARVRVCACVRVILLLVGKTLIFVLVWGTYYVPDTYVPGTSRQTIVWYQVRTYNIGLHPPPQKKTPGTSERFVANCGVGPSTRGQGNPASLVKPTQDQRR